MKGMNLQEQKKCGILLIAIGLVMFAVGFLLRGAAAACLPPEPRPGKGRGL